MSEKMSYSLSVGYLDNAIRLLHIIDQNPDLSLSEIRYIADTDDIGFRGISSSLIPISLDIGWIVIGGVSEKVAINSDLPTNDFGIKLQRELLWKYIENKRPPWTRHLHRGVKHAKMRITDSNEKQVFEDLNLFTEDTNLDIIDWWARAAIFSRSIDNKVLLETGNMGEILSLNYERERTGKDPFHAAFYSNKYGYDIESRVGCEDEKPLYIEVKTSTVNWQNAKFFLSRNEFDVCVKKGSNYIFHLWDLSGDKGTLLVINGDEIVNRSPIDQKGGQWENMSVSFSEFNWENAFEMDLDGVS